MINKRLVFLFWPAIVLTIGGFLFLFNQTPIGPEIDEKGPYYGCYGIGAPMVRLSPGRLTLPNGRSTPIKRILRIKTDDAINVTNEIVYFPKQHQIKIGSRSTGFFYKFRSSTEPKVLVLLDARGIPHDMSKIDC